MLGLIPTGSRVRAEDHLNNRETSAQANPPTFALGPRQITGVIAGVGGGAGAFLLNSGRLGLEFGFTHWGVALWIIGILGLLWGFWPRKQNTFSNAARFRIDPPLVATSVALLLILAMASFVRFYQLDEMPKEFGGDPASMIFEIRRIWDGTYPVFFTYIFGREPLMFYGSAAFMPFLGYSFLMLKVTSAVAGVLTVAVTYFMAREWFNSRQFGLLAAAVLALSYWPIVFSRLGAQIGLMPLFVALTLLFLFRSLKFGRSSDFLLCGLSLGAGLYTYTPFAVLPFAVGLSLFVEMTRRSVRKEIAKDFLLNSALLVLAALIVYAPLGRYAIAEPDRYFSRTLNITGQMEGPSLSPESLLTTSKKTFLMFNWQGDAGGTGGWANVPGEPQLDFLTGTLFILGASLTLIYWWFGRRSTLGYATLAFLVLLIPSIVSARIGEVPNASRAIGVIPLVFSIAAVPLYVVSSYMIRTLGKRSLLAVVPFVAGCLALIGFLNYQHYFDDYAGFYRNNNGNMTEVASVIRDFAKSGGDLKNAYVKTVPFWIDVQALAIQVGDLDWRNWLGSTEDARSHVQNPGAKLYVLHLDDTESLSQLQQIYPEGKVERFKSSLGERFDLLVFRVPARVGVHG